MTVRPLSSQLSALSSLASRDAKVWVPNRPLAWPAIARNCPASESPRLGTLGASQRGLCNAVQGLPGAIRPLFLIP